MVTNLIKSHPDLIKPFHFDETKSILIQNKLFYWKMFVKDKKIQLNLTIFDLFSDIIIIFEQKRSKIEPISMFLIKNMSIVIEIDQKSTSSFNRNFHCQI